jgi:hypothetical protein
LTLIGWHTFIFLLARDYARQEHLLLQIKKDVGLDAMETYLIYQGFKSHFVKQLN